MLAIRNSLPNPRPKLRRSNLHSGAGVGEAPRTIRVAISVLDPDLGRRLAGILSRSDDMCLESRRSSSDQWPDADVVLVDREVNAPMPAVVVSGSTAPGELETAIRAAAARRPDDSADGLIVGVWAVKGGCGTSTFAVNLAAAVRLQGLAVAYADLDFDWADGVCWFEDEPPGDLLPRALDHPSGLRGFVARVPDECDLIVAGLRSGFDVSVVDFATARLPGAVAAGLDLLFVLVPCDLGSLRRARRAQPLLPASVATRVIAVERPGSRIGPEDVDEVLDVETEAVLVHEPAVAEWTDRGRLIHSYRRSRWAREVRGLAVALVEELTGEAGP